MSAIVVGGATPESLGTVREVTPSSRGRVSRLACSALVLSWGFVWSVWLLGGVLLRMLWLGRHERGGPVQQLAAAKWRLNTMALRSADGL